MSKIGKKGKPRLQRKVKGDRLRAVVRADIAATYNAAERDAQGGRCPPHIAGIRIGELERLFQSRYGDTLPDDDSGRDDLVHVAHHFAHLVGGDLEFTAWARRWAPWLTAEEAENLYLRVDGFPVRFTADSLGNRLGVTRAERKELGITTFGAAGQTKADRVAERAARDREAKKAKRAAKAMADGREPGVNGRPRKNPSTAKIESNAVDGFLEIQNPIREAARPNVCSGLCFASDSPSAARPEGPPRATCFGFGASPLTPNIPPGSIGGFYLDYPYLNQNFGGRFMRIINAELSDERIQHDALILLDEDAPESWNEGDSIVVRRKGKPIAELEAVAGGLFSWMSGPTMNLHIKVEDLGGSFARLRLSPAHVAIMEAQVKAA